jgi:hypothetical protein
MSSFHHPPPRTYINFTLRHCSRFNSVAPVSYTNYSMALLFVLASRPRSWTEFILPPLPWPSSNWTFMVIISPTHLQALYLRLVHLVFFCIHSTKLMPRQRGRPRRGSPWNPRWPQPSVSPPGSPSMISSPPL